ncbi:DUF4143 domain-containing protein [Thiomicrospira microaerophila]|uniref:DUF4143 domain-containing protein n=1 Tax=Thiomicrospira microaerophila TaxID=406020 RepID=UPI0005C923B1|nr:DUF4143 domain-containing protein [Thiomicrospira microaerophila]
MDKKTLIKQLIADIIDNGFLTQLSFRYQQDHGKLLENLIAINLRAQNQSLHFIKGSQECDFVFQTNEGMMPLQVAYAMISATLILWRAS